MIYPYSGNHIYSRLSVSQNSPSDNIGVYYCGYTDKNILHVFYIGRAMGDSVSIQSRLLDHLRDDNWPDVTHFGYRTCTRKRETEEIEAAEIKRLQPKYNTVGKVFTRY